MNTVFSPPYRKRLTMSLALVVVLSVAVGLMGTFKDALLAPWFWLFAASESLLPDFEFQGLPVLSAAFAVIGVLAASFSKRASIIFSAWLVLNYLGVLWFLMVYNGRS
ncbi:MAG: hypothetical protein MN733_35815 [Nitrososphaera sp.]|nr:hypothetical protein [Nitrososphaera sp.]